MNDPDNLFENIPSPLEEEWMETLAECKGPFRIERIVSRGHASPPNFWYDQDSIEWVFLLSGSAVLEFEQDSRVVSLNPGDWIKIPSHKRHRVKMTAKDEDTVWLAIHAECSDPE